MATAWMTLIAAGLIEIGCAFGLKYSEGFTRLWPTLATAAAMALSLLLLTLSLKAVPIGTAYAVWTGIGAVGTVVLGIVWFGESADAARLACVALIIVGMIGLKVTAAP